MESRWRVQAERNSLLRGLLPAVRAEKRDEATRLNTGVTQSIMAALDQPQILIFDTADRHNQSAAIGKLRDKRSGHGGRRRSHEDSVVRREFRQAKRTVAAMHVNVLIAQARETLSGLRGKLCAELYGEDLARHAGQHGGLIAKSRSDFQHPFVS